MLWVRSFLGEARRGDEAFALATRSESIGGGRSSFDVKYQGDPRVWKKLVEETIRTNPPAPSVFLSLHLLNVTEIRVLRKELDRGGELGCISSGNALHRFENAWINP